MRLLHSIHSVDPRGGGVVEGVKLLAEMLSRAGHEVEVVSLDDPDSEWVGQFPCRLHPVGPGFGNYGYTPRLPNWIRTNARRFDTIIVHGLWQYSGFGVWQGISGLDFPYFVFTHGMLDPWFKRAYPLKHLKKWLYWPWGEYRVLRDARAVLFTSEEERLLARQSFWLYRCNERVVGYGTKEPPAEADLQKRKFYARFPQLQGKNLLLFLGRIHVKKGIDLLVEAFGKHLSARTTDGQSPHLVLAGPCHSEAYLAEMKKLADAVAPPESITWAGMLEGDLKWGAFRAAEAFILPSHQENFGIAVAEAMACGLPVLITDKINIWREILEDRAGLIEPDTLEGVAALLRKWQAFSREEKLRMRAAATACFFNRFRAEKAAERLVSIIVECGGCSRQLQEPSALCKI